uniref:Saposin containing protein n=1 Tax=Schistosoma mansoni TaxID=6183 RepID=A0A3Q0KK40_SCHMA
MKYFICVIITVIIGVALSYSVKNVDMSNTKETVDYQLDNNSTCSMCIQFITKWQTYLNSTSVDEKIEQFIRSTCSFYFFFRYRCEEFMERYVNKTVYIIQHNNATTLCKVRCNIVRWYITEIIKFSIIECMLIILKVSIF